jgi:cardiolipin synthase A/B
VGPQLGKDQRQAKTPGFLVLLGVCLLLSSIPLSTRGAVVGSESVNQWRRLTGQSTNEPNVFVRKDTLRVYFNTPQGHIQFNADLGRARIPTDGYEIHSALLQLNEKPSRMPKAERGWREGIVIGGLEWQTLAADLVEAMTPTTPGHGRYFQGLIADRLLFRDSAGVAKSTTAEQPPEAIAIEAHFSIEETLQELARLMGHELTRTHPGQALFLIIAPNSRHFPQPLLLDVVNRQCVWLLPKGLTDPERGLSLVTSPEGLRAFFLEGQGLALLKNPVSSAARLADLGLQTVARLFRLPLPRGAPPPVTPSAGMDLVRWEKWLDCYTGTRSEPGRLALLIDGEQFFPRLQEAIAGATNHIRFESFIFDRDDVATGIADRLKERSTHVQTQVLMDRLGSLAAGLSPPATPLPDDFVSPPSITSYLRNGSDVHVRHFLNPWFSTDHSKIYLVDGAQAWLGGMNIGREYRVEWHDLMVEASGPVVDSLENAFGRHWAHEGPWGDLGYVVAWLNQAQPISTTPPPVGPWIPVRRLPTRTFWKPFSAAVQTSIREARNYIYVENSYLFDRRVIRGLVRARHRGVDVRVILPRVNDFKAGARSNLVTANFLLAHGVRVFFYPGMTHVKALMVDDWVCLGSGNLNHLSLRLTQEENIATSDPSFTEQVKRDVFERDFAHCYELTKPLEVNWLDLLADLATENL